jgi:hypothetical protein
VRVRFGDGCVEFVSAGFSLFLLLLIGFFNLVLPHFCRFGKKPNTFSIPVRAASFNAQHSIPNGSESAHSFDVGC